MIALGEFEVVIRNSNAFKLMKNSLKGINISAVQTDVGPIVDAETNRLNPNSTFDSFTKWLEGENSWISGEVDSLGKKPPDLIITDISPIALKLADKIGCPCATVANFSWIDILKLLPQHKAKERILDWLSECFEIPQLVIKLPFSMKMEGFRRSRIRDASLLYRKPTLTIEATRRESGCQINKPLVVVSFGGHALGHLKFETKDARVVLLSPFPIETDSGVQVIIGHPESQNLIQAADFVIAKAGYSTLAECVAFRRPLNIISRNGYPEDTLLVREASKLGIGLPQVDIQRSNYCVKIPDIEEVMERERTIQYSQINKLERQPAASELIRQLI